MHGLTRRCAGEQPLVVAVRGGIHVGEGSEMRSYYLVKRGGDSELIRGDCDGQ